MLRFGTMRALVLGLEVVLPDGQIHNGLSALAKDNRGYDLTQLMIGAEGTLGIVTAASLRLVPAISDSATAWIGVDSPVSALAMLRTMEAASGNAIESFEIIAAKSLAASADNTIVFICLVSPFWAISWPLISESRRAVAFVFSVSS